MEAVDSQQKEDFICALVSGFSYFGGVAQTIVCDNLRSSVDESSKYESIVNKNLSALALHYNSTILPTRADKSLVEGAVKLAYQRIFYKLGDSVFFSLAELNTAIKPLLAAYNDQLFQGLELQ